jgi:hypothetical protein
MVSDKLPRRLNVNWIQHLREAPNPLEGAGEWPTVWTALVDVANEAAQAINNRYPAWRRLEDDPLWQALEELRMVVTGP